MSHPSHADIPPKVTTKVLSVAPMMAYTDRHCRRLHRLFAPDALVFTEMVTTGALLHGQQWHQLDFSGAEQPIALQLGGSDPDALAQCAEIAVARGYDEINLNVGCPSPRVKKGAFGACLMLEPTLVAECVAAMSAISNAPVTVKCRLGVDDHDDDEKLDHFVKTIADAGCGRFYIHARKALLNGLSPAQNRSVPPLQYERVRRVKEHHPNLHIAVNGGIDSLAASDALLQWADGVMLGRAAYQHPQLLSDINQGLHPTQTIQSTLDILASYRDYMVEQLSLGVRLHSMTRHLLTVCHGRPGARKFRQLLSNPKRLAANDITVFDEAIDVVFARAA